ncbi:MAG: hypothetical protein Q7J54_02145 [Candidatus Woesearchaeota archaeon]|nr:hypothetical protein [Candidatus Woesearchaeota archaeon]
MAEKIRSERELLESIEHKLDKLIGVTAIQGKEDKLRAKILKSLGFKYREISELTGIAEGTLKIWDHRSKKGGKNAKN